VLSNDEYENSSKLRVIHSVSGEEEEEINIRSL
jgi:hypothetical protein